MRTKTKRSDAFVIVDGKIVPKCAGVAPSGINGEAFTPEQIQQVQDSEKECALGQDPERVAQLDAMLAEAVARKAAKMAAAEAKSRPKHQNASREDYAAANAAPVSGQISVRENERFDGVEIRFPGPVKPEISQSLKKAGFNFTKSLNDPRWYAKRKPETLAFARKIAGESGQTAVIMKSDAPKTEPVHSGITAEEFAWV